MSRFALVPCAALATGALILTACGSNVAGTSVTASAGAKSTAAAPSTPGATPTAKQASVPAKSATDALAALPRGKFMSVVLTPAQVATFSPSMTRTVAGADTGADASTDPQVTGAGGTCPALGKLMSKAGVFGSDRAGTVDVTYDNTLRVTGDTQNDFRMIGQSIETSPKVDPVATVRSYRVAVAGCANKLTDGDGFVGTVRLLPDPAGMGTESFAMEMTSELGKMKIRTVLTATASGRNGMAVMTTGYTPAQDTAIAAQAWKNVVAQR